MQDRVFNISVHEIEFGINNWTSTVWLKTKTKTHERSSCQRYVNDPSTIRCRKTRENTCRQQSVNDLVFERFRFFFILFVLLDLFCWAFGLLIKLMPKWDQYDVKMMPNMILEWFQNDPKIIKHDPDIIQQLLKQSFRKHSKIIKETHQTYPKIVYKSYITLMEALYKLYIDLIQPWYGPYLTFIWPFTTLIQPLSDPYGTIIHL